MASKAEKLGGLADIFQSEQLDGTISRIKLSKIKPSQEQPRQERKIAISELASSIQRDGLLSPLVVTKEGDSYRIIAGERRYHAISQLKWEEVECRIISRKEMDYWRIAIIENLQRENLNPQEEAKALVKLKQKENLNDTELSHLVGKSRNYISEILSIASLSSEVLQKCKKYDIASRNMLIQVVQAEKKGIVQDFFKAFSEGLITNVREAKHFNQKLQDSAAKKPKTTKPEDSFAPSHHQLYYIKRSGSKIKIQCPNRQDSQYLEKEIRKYLDAENLPHA